MGTPLPENPVGSDCSNCWGAGKPFGIGPTPEIITITLFDLLEGFFWTDAVGAEALVPTQLFQTDIPCIWLAESSTIKWEFGLSDVVTVLDVTDLTSNTFIFTTIFGPPCLVAGPSDITGPLGVFAWSGRFEFAFSGVFT